MKKGYEETYNWVVSLLQNCNFEDSSKRLNIKQISEDEVSVDFLGRIYSVSKKGIQLVGQKIVWPGKTEEFDYNLKSVLGYYVLSEAGMGPFKFEPLCVLHSCFIVGFAAIGGIQ